MIDLLWVGLGLGLLLGGAEGVVRAGRVLAGRAGVSELAVGLVVASVGTSLPELFTAAIAARSALGGDGDAAAIGFGNVAGSNLFLLFFLLGLVAVVRPMPVDPGVWRRDGVAVGLSTVLLLGFALDGRVGPVEGGILLLGFVVWLARVGMEESGGERVEPVGGPAWPSWGFVGILVVGLGLLALGSDLVVDHGVRLATRLHVGPTLIGVLAGVGTSLPEVGVSLRAGEEGASLSLGNLLGSVVTNGLLCAGVAAVVGSLDVPVEARSLELPFLVAAAVVVLALSWDRSDLSRAEGVALLALFGLYLTLRIIG